MTHTVILFTKEYIYILHLLYRLQASSNRSISLLTSFTCCASFCTGCTVIASCSHLAISWYMALILASWISHVLQTLSLYVSKQSNVRADTLSKTPTRFSVSISTLCAMRLASTSMLFRTLDSMRDLTTPRTEDEIGTILKNKLFFWFSDKITNHST